MFYLLQSLTLYGQTSHILNTEFLYSTQDLSDHFQNIISVLYSATNKNSMRRASTINPFAMEFTGNSQLALKPPCVAANQHL